MVQPEWVRESLAGGAGSVVILSCPADDCAFREGPRWLAARLERYRSLFQPGVRRVEAAPGDQGAVPALLRGMESRKGVKEKGGKEKHGKTESLFPFPLSSFSPFLAGLAVLALMFTLALAVEPPATATPPDQGVIRVVLVHSGQLKATSASLPPEVMAKLPENVAPEQVLGGERFPVRLRTQIDDHPVVERVYRPGGLRREGQVYGLVSWSLPPGSHQVRLWIMDDERTWRPVFFGPVAVEAGRVHSLRYDKGKATFILSAE